MRILVISLLMLVLISIAGFVALKPQVFAIKNIECYTQFGYCNPDLVDKANFLLGRPIYLPFPKKQIASTFAGIPNISEVSIYRRLPSTAVLSIDLRQPLAVVLGASNQRTVVDENGVLYEEVERSALPTLMTEGDVVAGGNLTQTQLTASKLLSRVAAIVATTVTGRLSGNTLTATTGNGVQIILDINSLSDDWPTSLQSIWARSKIDGKIMRKIDLRYSRPAVSY